MGAGGVSWGFNVFAEGKDRVAQSRTKAGKTGDDGVVNIIGTVHTAEPLAKSVQGSSGPTMRTQKRLVPGPKCPSAIPHANLG